MQHRVTDESYNFINVVLVLPEGLGKPNIVIGSDEAADLGSDAEEDVAEAAAAVGSDAAGLLVVDL